MAYAVDADVNNLYGSSNVSYWADITGAWVKGAADTAAMTARRAAALDYATDRIDSRLRQSDLNFKLPITTPPKVVVDICAKLAGRWMSTFRHGDRLAKDEQEALDKLEMIATGHLKLDI